MVTCEKKLFDLAKATLVVAIFFTLSYMVNEISNADLLGALDSLGVIMVAVGCFLVLTLGSPRWTDRGVTIIVNSAAQFFLLGSGLVVGTTIFWLMSLMV